MQKEEELEGCTFSPALRRGDQLPYSSYLLEEERQFHLQHYLEGQSYIGESDEDDFAIYNGQSINYVNNL